MKKQIRNLIALFGVIMLIGFAFTIVMMDIIIEMLYQIGLILIDKN